MGSLGSGELIVIAIVALVVFGPKRLPELAKKAGELLAQARSATRTLTETMDSEYSDISAPLQTLKAEYDLTMNELKNVGSTVTGMGVTLPGEEAGEDNRQQTADDRQEPDKAGEEEEAVSQEEADSRQLTADSGEEEEEDVSHQASAGREDEEDEERAEEGHGVRVTGDDGIGESSS